MSRTTRYDSSLYYAGLHNGATAHSTDVMSKVTNLRQFRKRKARQQADQHAAENRARFGRTPAQRKQDEERRERDAWRLDQQRLESSDDAD